MKKTLYILLAALPLLAGCDLNEYSLGGVGTPIKFTANTYYENGPGTKTDYSGDFFGTSPRYERIDWVDGDLMHIWAEVDATHTANENYSVTSHSANGKDSNAEIEASSSGINWLSQTEQHTFYAMYPAPSIHHDGEKVALARNIIKATVPAAQTVSAPQNVTVNNVTRRVCKPNMDFAFMWAATRADVGAEVNLGFKPLVTAFEITVGAEGTGASMQLASFSLEAVDPANGPYLAGDFVATINNSLDGYIYSLTNNTSRSKSITVNLGNVTVTHDNPVTFTLFALPQTVSGLKMVFNFTGGGGKSVELNNGGTPVTFDAAKKYRISNVYIPDAEIITYTIEQIDDIILYGHQTVSGGLNVRSYSESTYHPGEKTALTWKIQYKPEGGTWTDLDANGVNRPDNALFKITSAPTGTGVNTTTYNAGEPRTANIIGDNPNHDWAPGTSEPASEIARRILRAASPRGGNSSATAFDLSMHPAYGSIDTPYAGNKMTTANCYTVSAAGYYKFPLVYGNAMTKGENNKAAYWPAAATSTSVTHPADPVYGAISHLSDINDAYNVDSYVNHYYLPQFYNAYNQGISDPYILTDLNLTASAVEAVVIWQDKDKADDPALIPYDGSQIGVTSDGYIWFKIEQEVIRPGNIVIAVRRKDNHMILWSWHIWITEKDLNPTDHIRGINLMPYNLGFVEGDDAAVDQYTDRSLLFRVVGYTTEGGTVTERAYEEFNVTQKGDAKEFAPSIGSNPYYQWGRKDPIIPSRPGGKTRWIIPNTEYTDLPSNPEDPSIAMDILPNSTAVDYATSIKKPYKPLFNQVTTSWVGGTVYPFARGFQPNRLDSNPFTYDQLIVTVNNRLTVDGLVPTGSWINQFVGTDPNNPRHYIYFIDHYNPALASNPLSYNEVQNLLGIDQTNHFKATDFDTVPGSTAAQRSASALAYNLWNSFIYSDNVNTRANKFKTVYDPCPPGFTVPVRYMIVGNTWPLTWKPSEPGTPIHRENANPMALSPVVSVDRASSTKGVYYDGAFFPYTGGRVLIYTDLTAQEQGSGAYYWTDNPFNMQGSTAPAGQPDQIGYPANPTNISDHWFYQFGLILSTNRGGSSVTSSPDKAWSFTKGSAAAIRPMVDPAY